MFVLIRRPMTISVQTARGVRSNLRQRCHRRYVRPYPTADDDFRANGTWSSLEFSNRGRDKYGWAVPQAFIATNINGKWTLIWLKMGIGLFAIVLAFVFARFLQSEAM
ncbi:hypothetical protein QE152_g25782 [Popillia japonica]|uniref:Uncharacterized protein n=1 Tax=Popillia japonica TaxID=7064 RepID=A0AAW1K0G5_POPJA